MNLLRPFAILCLLLCAALTDAVEVYDMRYLDRAPLRYEMADVRALALGTTVGITILNSSTLAVVNRIEQPASALVWLMYDNRLIAGWERHVTVFDSIEQEQSASYPVLETLIAYETLDPNIETRHHIRNLQTLWESPRRWSLFIVYGYDINYGNHGESFRGVSQYSFAEETLTDVTGDMEDIIRERERVQFTYDEQYALIGNVWIDGETGQTVILPLTAPA